MRGPAARSNEHRPLIGIFLMLAAYIFFSFIDTGAKWLMLFGLPAMQVAFMRYVGQFVISIALIARGGFSFERYATNRLPLVLTRGLLLMLSTVFNFLAVRYLPLTLTATILFTTPILVCALSGPLLGERVGVWRWSAIVVGLGGILIAVRPFGADVHWAVVLSFGAAVSFSLYSILTRKLSGLVATDTLQAYSGVVGVVVLAPVAFVQWQTPETGFQWIVLASLGVFGWVGHEALTRAHGFAPASTLTPFVYSLIVYMTFWSYVVFDQPPDLWTMVGALIVVGSGLFIWFRERQLGRPPKPASALAP